MYQERAIDEMLLALGTVYLLIIVIAIVTGLNDARVVFLKVILRSCVLRLLNVELFEFFRCKSSHSVKQNKGLNSCCSCFRRM